MRMMRFTLLLLLACSHAAFPQQDPITVGVALFPANVIESEQPGRDFEGFDIDLWEEIARITEIDFVYRRMPFEQLLEEVAAGDADMGLAGISIRRAREQQMDFSYPYMDSGLGILSRRGGYRLGALWDVVAGSGAFRWLGY